MRERNGGAGVRISEGLFVYDAGDDDFVFDYFFSDKYSYEIVDEMALAEESLPEEMVFDDSFMYESGDSAAEKL